ncbi:hypothetical protein RR46_02561 [Papilio xuthus]|uniref:Uncharacterized protein n=1 Tax=Papilio xuthus TaxID=66420 RepID=A0A194Q252_PAPXU|nr:hypothetical protein RR46_02561 [Papilio xuthus]
MRYAYHRALEGKGAVVMSDSLPVKPEAYRLKTPRFLRVTKYRSMGTRRHHTTEADSMGPFRTIRALTPEPRTGSVPLDKEPANPLTSQTTLPSHSFGLSTQMSVLTGRK